MFISILFINFICFYSCFTLDVQIIVVPGRSSERSNGYERFLRSADILGYKSIENVVAEEANTSRLSLLRPFLDKYCNNDDILLLVIADPDNTLLVRTPEEMVMEFRRHPFGTVLFAGERNRRASLNAVYNAHPPPPVATDEYRFINNNLFVGIAKHVCQMLKNDDLSAETNDLLHLAGQCRRDDQNKKENGGYFIKIDRRADIFQTLSGAENDVDLRFATNTTSLYNSLLSSYPVVVTSGGEVDIKTRATFNRFGDYLANSFVDKDCIAVKYKPMKLDESNLPTILLAVFIPRPTPFLEYFLRSVEELSYPRNKISLYVSNSAEFHESAVSDWIGRLKTVENAYSQLIYKDSSTGLTEHDSKNEVLQLNQVLEYDYIFYLDSHARLKNTKTLQFLIEQNRDVVAPFLRRPNQLWSNMWGQITSSQWYERSVDYLDIISGDRKCIWNVPFVSSAFLLRGSRFAAFNNLFSVINTEFFDTEVVFSYRMRENGIFMYANNLIDFGHLINYDNYDVVNNYRPDLLMIEDNLLDWERKYLNPDVKKLLSKTMDENLEEGLLVEPCQDVYRFPLATGEFCSSVIQVMEHYGKWSGGRDNHHDPRLGGGGYENVPTVDIHLNQVGLNDMWLNMIRLYMGKVAEKVFMGYSTENNGHLNFVVRYHPREQAFLKPHFDSSSYTVNLALNQRNVDFEGGGVRFTRFNCSIVDTRPGFGVMNPGRVTHKHEGLETVSGVRYILVSFIDP